MIDTAEDGWIFLLLFVEDITMLVFHFLADKVTQATIFFGTCGYGVVEFEEIICIVTVRPSFNLFARNVTRIFWL